MTIAAGVRCTDGIIIGADTENTEGNSKYQRSKIWADADHLIITGAGATSYMKMAFDKIAHRFSRSKPDTPEIARAKVERIVRQMHQEHVFPLYGAGHASAQAVDFWLIVAARCGDGNLALIRTELTTASLVPDFDAVGSGREIFKYWARYFLSGFFDMDVASYFSMFIIREAKDSAAFVGGSTQVCKMAKDVAAPRVYRTMFSDHDILAGFPATTVNVLLKATDLKAHDTAFEYDLDIFKALVKQLRGALRSNVHMIENARMAFRQVEENAKKVLSANAPEPPPEQSGDVVPKKASGRVRRRP